MTTLTPPALGTRQHDALAILKAERAGFTVPELRDMIGLPGDTYGTRQMHSVIRRLVELDYVTKVEISDKIATEHRVGTTGRKPTHRVKITAEGRKALKAAS